MKRPLPRVTAESRPFWTGCANGVVRYQRCKNCGSVQPIPRSLCVQCQSTELDWRTSAGLGRILTFTIVHRPPTPAFQEESPYAIAIIDMDEGFRLMTQVAPSPLAIDQRVRIGFRMVDGVTLPHAEACA